MNWQKYYDAFQAVNVEDISLFATPREINEAVNAFNKALNDLKKDKSNSKNTLRIISAIANDYPMFPQASHVLAISIAEDRDYEKALDLLKKVSLLDVDAQESKMLKEQISILEKEIAHQKSKHKDKSPQYTKKQNKKEVSIADVLTKAPKGKNAHHLNREEINELNRKLGNDNPLDLSGEVAYEEKKNNIRFTGFVILIALFVLSIFYFGIRPAILNASGNNVKYLQQLQWLENELTDRAKEDASIQQLLDDYFAEFQEQENQTNVQATSSQETISTQTETIPSE